LRYIAYLETQTELTMQKQKKRKKRKNKVIVSTQISKLQQLVYDSGVPISFINVEDIFDASLPAVENKRNVEYEIERLKKEMRNYAEEITVGIVGEKKEKK